MNVIDRKFYDFVENVKCHTKEELFVSMKQQYQFLSDALKQSFETYFQQFPYWGKLDHQKDVYDEIFLKATSLKEHLEDYVWLYERLGDYRSKKLLYAMMNNWYCYDFQTLKEANETCYSHYFDLDLVQCDENEVFVDLGAYVGDTILDYRNVYGKNSYQKIYAYEMTDDSFEKLKTTFLDDPKVECRKKAVGKEKGILYVESNCVDASANTLSMLGDRPIDVVCLDEDIEEKITLLKMDIEGFEQNAILGARRHIEEEHPTLLLSVYHNNEDIYQIPRMVDAMNPNYQFYLRSHGGCIFPTEITLLAIDSKR